MIDPFRVPPQPEHTESVRRGWDRLNSAQRMLFGFWMPSLIVVFSISAVGLLIVQQWLWGVPLLVVAVVGAISVILTIRDGASRWPRPR